MDARQLSKDAKFAGIAFDSVLIVPKDAAEMQMDYDLLIAGVHTLAVSKDLGNQAGVLPFAVVFDRTGKVAGCHAGGLNEASLDAALLPLL